MLRLSRIVVILVILSGLLLTACPKQCKPKMARCLNNCTQLCRPDGKWNSVVDCSKLDPKGKWTCACTDAQTCRCKKSAEPPVPVAR